MFLFWVALLFWVPPLLQPALVQGGTEQQTAPDIPEEIKALIEKPGAEIQIECKFVEIEKDPDRPLA